MLGVDSRAWEGKSNPFPKKNIVAKNIFVKNIFVKNIFQKNIFTKNIFQKNIFTKNIYFLPFPHLTSLQTTPLLINDF